MSIWIAADVILLLLIAVLGYFSHKRGFLKSSYHGISSFVALLLVFNMHMPFQAYLEHSAVGDTVREKIHMNIEASITSNPDINSSSNADAAEEAVKDLKLSGFITSWLTDIIKLQKDSLNSFKVNLVDSITDIVFPVVMQILSVLILYLIIRFCLWLVFCLLRFVLENPVFRTIDKLLGAVVGGVNALLIIYIAAALIMLLTPVNSAARVEAGINSTVVFKYFYYNNLLSVLLFK